MNFVEDVRKLIGHTPILHIRNTGITERVRLMAKLELLIRAVLLKTEWV